MSILKEIKYKDFIIKINEDKNLNVYNVSLYDPIKNKSLMNISTDMSMVPEKTMLIEVDNFDSRIESIFGPQIANVKSFADNYYSSKMLFD